ncbi:hypothetical protein LTS08_005448 [Lithohypha guttulata]|uniref:uncharacterized protein n=1 Tax=Lithohypha guttulata TaxID=1690604 RepID=UPI002DE1176D|nr:hypothetical protein LTR51_003373 [Lithohypha guttulata]KAK5099733.1 hypothetical protein LTS08_005448 [Lithohypha guttulata]
MGLAGCELAVDCHLASPTAVVRTYQVETPNETYCCLAASTMAEQPLIIAHPYLYDVSDLDFQTVENGHGDGRPDQELDSLGHDGTDNWKH